MKKILLVIVFLFAVLCVTFWGNNNALGSDRFEATDLEDAVIGSGEVTTYLGQEVLVNGPYTQTATATIP